jgi:hypothetical protein
MVAITHPDSLDGYLRQYAPALARQTQTSLRPLHRPGVDQLQKVKLLREPFEPQWHVINAGVKQLQRDDALIIVGECGTGKTIMGMAVPHSIAHIHAKGKPYRVIAMFPPQLAAKWEREVLDTIPGAIVKHITCVGDLIKLDKHSKPTRPEYYLIKETGAKMGAAWQAATSDRRISTTYNEAGKEIGAKLIPSDVEVHHCPKCGGEITKETEKHGSEPVDLKKLSSVRHRCDYLIEHFTADGRKYETVCDEPLWTFTNETGKWEPARYIKDHLKHFFNYFIVDEVHEQNSFSSARGEAMAMIAAATKKKIALTGTLFGGYAWHVFCILMRLAPASLIADGITWKDAAEFDKRYGRMFTRVTTTTPGDRDGQDNKQSKGSKKKTDSRPDPGILPTLFGKHLIDKCVFLSLEDLSDCLPPFDEKVISVAMDKETAEEYERVEDILRAEVKMLMRQQNMSLLSAMLHTLLDFADHPYGWDWVGYWKRASGAAHDEKKRFVKVVKPADLGLKLRPKEKELLKFIREEKKAGRQVWVYVNSTDTRDVAQRVYDFLTEAGFSGTILRAEKVGTSKREAWIAANAPGLDFVVSHPKPVRTGLDLFCKRATYNFVSLYFYQTGYDLFTLRQAARRSWRIGQTKICKVRYSFYRGTMQERAMTLMGRKLAASEMIEGNSQRISSEGLAAMTGGDSSSMEIELANSLVEKLDDLKAERSWQKITTATVGNAAMIDAEIHAVDDECAIEIDEGVVAMKVERPITTQTATVTGGTTYRAAVQTYLFDPCFPATSRTRRRR